MNLALIKFYKDKNYKADYKVVIKIGMKMNLISSESLAEEGNFHSFILCQTKNIPLS